MDIIDIDTQYIIQFASKFNLPYVNTIATFITRRCFEQVAVDLCLHRLPVRLIGNGGGLVYAPLGPTHQAIEDISIMRTLPNMTIIAPCDSIDMKKLVMQTVNHNNPIYIRLAKGGDEIVTSESDNVVLGKGVLKIEPNEHLFITTGVMTQMAIEASKRLNNERHFDVQILGGIALHENKIAEMKTGEGKTLVSTMPIILNAICSQSVHVITVNDYLAERD